MTMKRFYCSLALGCLFASTLWATDDPFCGKWKLNMAKSLDFVCHFQSTGVHTGQVMEHTVHEIGQPNALMIVYEKI
jgi:hypothetical protein